MSNKLKKVSIKFASMLVLLRLEPEFCVELAKVKPTPETTTTTSSFFDVGEKRLKGVSDLWPSSSSSSSSGWNR